MVIAPGPGTEGEQIPNSEELRSRGGVGGGGLGWGAVGVRWRW